MLPFSMEKHLRALESLQDCHDLAVNTVLGSMGGREPLDLIWEQASREARRLGIECPEPPKNVSHEQTMNFIAGLIGQIKKLDAQELKEKTVLTVPEAAELLGVGESKVTGWIRSGKLKATNVSNASRPSHRISREAINELETRSQPKPRKSKRKQSDVIEFFPETKNE